MLQPLWLVVGRPFDGQAPAGSATGPRPRAAVGGRLFGVGPGRIAQLATGCEDSSSGSPSRGPQRGRRTWLPSVVPGRNLAALRAVVKARATPVLAGGNIASFLITRFYEKPAGGRLDFDSRLRTIEVEAAHQRPSLARNRLDALRLIAE